MPEDKKNLSEGLKLMKNETLTPEDGLVSFGLEKQGIEMSEEMNRENMGKLINRTVDILNLVQRDKENLREELPESTIESKPVEEKVDNYVTGTEEEIIELRELESKLDLFLAELDSELSNEIVKKNLPKNKVNVSDFEEIRSKDMNKFDVDVVKVDNKKILTSPKKRKRNCAIER